MWVVLCGAGGVGRESLVLQAILSSKFISIDNIKVILIKWRIYMVRCSRVDGRHSHSSVTVTVEGLWYTTVFYDYQIRLT